MTDHVEDADVVVIGAGGGVVHATTEQARPLHVRDGADLFELYRLRTADTEPIGLQASYLPMARLLKVKPGSAAFVVERAPLTRTALSSSSSRP
jgi:hypothetical protein